MRWPEPDVFAPGTSWRDPQEESEAGWADEQEAATPEFKMPPSPAGASETMDETLERIRRYVTRNARSPEETDPPVEEPAPKRPVAPIPSKHRKPKRADLDRDLREKYHDDVRVFKEDEHEISYTVNKNWILPYAEVQRDLWTLFQLHYDIASLVLNQRMSTTAYSCIKERVIAKSDTSLSGYVLNTDLVTDYSSRHFLVLAPSSKERKELALGTGKDATWATIRDKTNWAAKHVNEIRKEHRGLSDYSTAKQVEDIAESMRRALNLPTAPARLAALERIPKSIYIDTRSSLGRPINWHGFPINPNQGDTAYFRLVGGTWILAIKKTNDAQEIPENDETDGKRGGEACTSVRDRMTVQLLPNDPDGETHH